MTTASRRELPASLGDAARLFYGHWSPRLLTALAAGAVGARIAVGAWSLRDLAVAAAVVALWPLQEWLIHVYALHFEPRTWRGRTLDFRVPQLHRAHHREPWRPDLVFVPVQVFLYVPFVLGAVLLLGSQAAGLVLTGAGAYFALALHYEWIHFLIHTRYWPKHEVYRRLWRNHRLHHFKSEHYWFGVTMLSGDRWLHTAPDPESVPTSPTARAIEAAWRGDESARGPAGPDASGASRGATEAGSSKAARLPCD